MLLCNVKAVDEYTILSRNINKQCGSVLGLQACFVGLKCHLRYQIADLIQLVSVPQLIDFAVDNIVYSVIPSNSCMFLFM
jgi:hypothetical protein